MSEDEGILPILKFSYYHLSPSLKSCFSYCALFPKDHVIKKQFLINLWMAQGCLDSGVQDGQSIEDVGKEYFSILLQRCFLQDIIKNEYDEIESCKMHDLVHDLAQEVAGKEFSLVNSIPIGRKMRHVSINDRSLAALFTQNESLDKVKNLRTILLSIEIYLGLEVTKILAHGRHLRVLNLRDPNLRSIPNTLSSLIHLRYLDLSHNGDIEMLPKSITKLLNLKVLDLSGCSKLKELPKDLGKLVNLRQLDIRECNSLTHMPAGMDNLTSLHTLTMYVLGEGSSNQVQMGQQLQELKRLLQLSGELTIVVRNGYSYDATNAEGGYLVNKSQLKALTIQGGHNERAPKVIIEEGLLEGLKPHSNLEKLKIRGYRDMKLPHWAATLGSSLPLLVSLSLISFPRLKHLPSLSQLQHLKFLHLSNMCSVEYMVDDNNHVPFTQGSRTANVTTFFPSLETLYMCYLPKLKGWWNDDILWSMDRVEQDVIPSFPRLYDLDIHVCPHMTNFPRCPRLEKVFLTEVDKLRFFKEGEEAISGSQQTCSGVSSSSSSGGGCGGGSRSSKAVVSPNSVGLSRSIDIDNNNNHLVVLRIDNIEVLNSLIGEYQSRRVNTLYLRHSASKRLSDARIEHLVNDLQHLDITGCKDLELEEEGDGMMPWKALHSLTRLQLWLLPKMVNLPKGIQYLTSLQSLHIENCENLEVLPEWLDSLTSLQFLRLCFCLKVKSLPEAISRLPSLTRLQIRWCDDRLVERCTEPDGEDCPNIRHIPTFIISNSLLPLPPHQHTNLQVP